MDLLRSLPIGLYLEQPITWLHHLDPRVKLFWLMGFLLTPVLANSYWRILLVVLLMVMTWAARIPMRVWRQQMGWWTTLAVLIFFLTAISPDDLPVSHQPRRPDPASLAPLVTQTTIDRAPWYNPFHWGSQAPTSTSNTPDLPSATSYRYVLFQQGHIKITRQSLDLAIRLSTLIFTLIYSANLYLLTTSPEEITAGLEELLTPLARLRWPITEITLTLTLSLRFIPLVMEEFQNLVRSIWTRAINWKKLGLRQGAKVWLRVIERLLLNLLLRAEQIAGAIQVRGFTSPNEHQVQWHDLRLRFWDHFALGILGLFWFSRLWWGNL
jgi:energy-coupling factor transport system permease protein